MCIPKSIRMVPELAGHDRVAIREKLELSLRFPERWGGFEPRHRRKAIEWHEQQIARHTARIEELRRRTRTE
jgi:hypothetical protein